MLKGSKLRQWLSPVSHYELQSGASTSLALSEADANVGTLLSGSLVDYAADSDSVWAHITGRALGFLMDDINLYGTMDEVAYRKWGIGDIWNIPKARGAMVNIMLPRPHSLMLFEGVGAAAINNLVVTSGTGLLSAATARGSELSVIKGGLRLAQTDEMVFAHLEQANLTPLADPGNLRIRVKFVSPYKKKA